MAAVFGLLACLNLCACAARHILSDRRLAEAEAGGAGDVLRVYVSHRTITVYDRGVIDEKTVRKQIDERKLKDRLKVKLGRNDSGVLVEEELKNGERLLWIGFDRRCRQRACAFGFVHTEDGRYRLVQLPERDGYGKPYVYRSVKIKRHKMRPGRLRALSDANEVYELKRRRKRSNRTVFLEFKLREQDRVRTRGEDIPGVD